jgi:hypothetical protein
MVTIGENGSTSGHGTSASRAPISGYLDPIGVLS